MWRHFLIFITAVCVYGNNSGTEVAEKRKSYPWLRFVTVKRNPIDGEAFDVPSSDVADKIGTPMSTRQDPYMSFLRSTKSGTDPGKRSPENNFYSFLRSTRYDPYSSFLRSTRGGAPLDSYASFLRSTKKDPIYSFLRSTRYDPSYSSFLRSTRGGMPYESNLSFLRST